MARAAAILALALAAALWAAGGLVASAAGAEADREADLQSLDDLEAVEDLAPEADAEAAWDPLAGWNRGMYRFNDRLYFWVLKPVAEAYRKVVPLPARTGVKNFFHNLSMPIRFVNALLQLKIQQAKAELARFFFNSSAGILGFGDPARHYPELNPPPEDTGQTLGHWGIGPGPYIVWPFLGPSSLRDTFGLVGDYALHPLSYTEPIYFSAGVSAYARVNQISLVIGDYEAIQEAAIDPYIAIREAFVDNREKLVAE